MIAVRERNPTRSRERLLQAALAEFAAKGFAGARVEAIAKRAGLNKQLISHHFGGKRGLYAAVASRRKRSADGAELAAGFGPVPGALAELYRRALDDPEWMRVLLWETLDRPELTDPAGGVAGARVGEDEGESVPNERADRYRERVEWVRAEQAAGRLPAGLQPDLLVLSLLGAVLYPMLQPVAAQLITGEDVASPRFTARYRKHLRALAAALAEPSEGERAE